MTKSHLTASYPYAMYPMNYIDPENIPTAAEAERDAPTASEIARAIRERGPAPVTAADFGPINDTDRPF